ncbi:hypothetical protein DEU56DRAFT_916955 [Suillus clintonianus]|uniref:uncharacterized protein n=1 Tax=Suillus clintonianus TaxID=1904413 RepID=UPI001B8723D0|nr:uncharacterized protein DEU56DRAFT_916955 [Suillus clintonianus]KAG2124602.1 hypothetical protein DEU56DRAFT_916955 [Suillus clintonianus]
MAVDNNRYDIYATSTYILSFSLTVSQALGKYISQAVIVASVGVLFTATANAPFETSATPGITGCYQSAGSDELFLPFVLFALELGFISLTLVRAIQSWRTARNPLYDILLKHNILYYACGLFFSAVNVLTSLFLHYAYNAMLQDFQLIILAILATRMHLHLWHVDRHIHGSDALMLIPLTDVSSAGRAG